jgi:hypothetical protein
MIGFYWCRYQKTATPRAELPWTTLPRCRRSRAAEQKSVARQAGAHQEGQCDEQQHGARRDQHRAEPRIAGIGEQAAEERAARNEEGGADQRRRRRRMHRSRQATADRRQQELTSASALPCAWLPRTSRARPRLTPPAGVAVSKLESESKASFDDTDDLNERT